MSLRRSLVVTASAALALGGIWLARVHFGDGGHASARVDFNRDIRPIFNQNCVSCHGGVKQEANVSFIYRDEALGTGKSGRPTVVPGKPNLSELIARVTSTDPQTRMPQDAPALPARQIALLRQWIEEGAQWEDYWAFVPPRSRRLPDVKQPGWVRKPLDRFILARLEKESLAPSPEASKAELLRRVSFDLTGLPPTAEELAAFLTDPAVDAYEKQVDRLLASPHYGERWASMWLDLARYADTKGFDVDLVRPGVWAYRDWVIDAFNRNLTYDTFVITQLAGDLLPDATFEDRIATSFQRQTPANDECGSDDEEYRIEATMDRVATTWSVLNGVTINCVQCHSHPYDPIRHTEYYSFYAFYNTSRDADRFDDAPVMHVAKDASRRAGTAQLEQRRVSLLQDLATQGKRLEAHATWAPLPVEKAVADESLAWETHLAALEQARRGGKTQFVEPGTDVLPPPSEKPPMTLAMVIAQAKASLDRARSTGAMPLKIGDGSVEAFGDIPVRSVFVLLTEPARSAVTALRVESPPEDPVRARHSPEEGFIVDRIEAWATTAGGQERKIDFRYFIPDSQENLETAIGLEVAPGGEPASAAVSAFAANPKLLHRRWVIGVLDEPLPRGTRIRLHLSHSKEIDSNPAPVRQLRVTISGDPGWTRGPDETRLRDKRGQLVDVARRLAAIPSVRLPVMAEQATDERRATRVFKRGVFRDPVGPALVPDVPAVFPKLPANAPRNRLTMARWFFAPGQPMTARVAVNRYWEQLFGLGLVETLEDFGSSGEMPSHPELLDWLAIHFQDELQWDMKQLLRELVSSATYRQSARASAYLRERDPRNRLLTRGPQQRLTAEMVRDQALVASGLLSGSVGGPPVMPPQPASVSAESGSFKWIDARGSDRYRRAIYTFLKRTDIYPSLITFDASAHGVSVARRIPTNTPLQALVTLNDPVYHEAAESLARRMLAESSSVDRRLTFGAQSALSREPTARELESLRKYYEKTLATYRNETAASTAVASVLLNLDAALMR